MTVDPKFPILIRPVSIADVPQMLDIYGPIVRETAISFELDPPTLAEFEQRVRKCAETWAWVVAVKDEKVLGYAYGSSHRERKAYQWSTETSAYVLEAARGQGVGKALYRALLPALATRGYCNAFAGIALPNAASVALHQATGFTPIGTFPRVGHKFGHWHDVGWFNCRLRDSPPSRV